MPDNFCLCQKDLQQNWCVCFAIYTDLFPLKDHFKCRANKKNEHGEGIMLIQTFVLKVINDERKTLTHHEITDRIAKQIESVITQLRKESKL